MSKHRPVRLDKHQHRLHRDHGPSNVWPALRGMFTHPAYAPVMQFILNLRPELRVLAAIPQVFGYRLRN